MIDTSPPRRPFPASALAAVAIALLLAAGGFYAGRTTAPGPTTPAADPACKDARHTALDYREQVEADASPVPSDHDYEEALERHDVNARLYANTVVQNRACFTAGERAVAQATLDHLGCPVSRGAAPVLLSVAGGRLVVFPSHPC